MLFVCVWAPRPAKHERDISVPLDYLRHVEPSTLALHTNAMSDFQDWLDCHCAGALIITLVAAPTVLGMLIAEYGIDLFARRAPLYKYLMALTAIQRHYSSQVSNQLQAAWTVAHNWRLREPVEHRAPIPRALVKAIIAIAMLLGEHRFAGCVCIAFWGPGRIGEVMRALRENLVLPSDVLFDPKDMTLLSIVKPKSRNRGGAQVQHISIKSLPIAAFLSYIFGALPAGAKLFPMGPGAFRTRWDLCLARIGVPKDLFLPGGLRGGGAVSLYFEGSHIADLLWKMRIKHASTLTAYLQEVSAAVSLNGMSESCKTKISALSAAFDAMLSSF